MKVLYVISPDYLDAVIKETKEYTFAIQGYRNFTEANEALHSQNIKDVLGFIYISDRMPEYFTDVYEFIDRCSIMTGKDKTFLIVCKDSKDVKDFLDYLEVCDLTLKVIAGYEVLTDVIIRNAVSTILMTQMKPYVETDTIEEPMEDDDTSLSPTLHYEQIFEPNVLDITMPVLKMSSVEETIRYDNIILKYRLEDEITYALRLAYIKANFGIFQSIKAQLEKVKFNNYYYCILKCVENTINNTYRNNIGGGLNEKV